MSDGKCVPPTGDVEVLAWIISDEDGTIDATVRWDVAKHSFGHVTSMVSQTAHQAEVARLTAERDAALEGLEDLRHWRDLALQFDNHRLQALWHLKALLQSHEHTGAAHEFLESPPMAAHEVNADRDALQSELTKVRELLNTPHTDDWIKGVRLEAGHQIGRWGSEHDAGKSPADWFWLIGYLAQKAMTAHMAGNEEKARHHTISTGAALLNWFRAIVGDSNAMRPGIAATPIAHNVDESCGQDAEAAKGDKCSDGGTCGLGGFCKGCHNL